ncbi:MAG TPA: 4Fe-4S binding protein [Candidatus Limnocylindrales bacterium]|nr:4Fe-4S binding protein [Candidatus Limnocylindrales bacterium]
MKALVFHAEKCIGCKLCQLACSAQNEGEFNPRLARLKITSHYTRNGFDVRGQTCDFGMGCVDICPVDAIVEKNGRLSFKEELCTDCALCVDNCPNQVIVKKEKGIGICVQCKSCTNWCPTEALTFEEVNK